MAVAREPPSASGLPITHWSQSELARQAVRRGSFTSRQDLKAKIEAFIAYFNQTLAKPFRWTYTGKPLAA